MKTTSSSKHTKLADTPAEMIIISSVLESVVVTLVEESAKFVVITPVVESVHVNPPTPCCVRSRNQ